jgi:mRNA interferase MazF
LLFWIKKRMTPARGEVWLFDLGMAAKTRPALIVSVAFSDLDRAIVTVVPHTTKVRGSTFEVSVRVPFLKPGAFLVQGVSTYPTAWAIRRLGALTREQMELIMTSLANWLGLAQS